MIVGTLVAGHHNFKKFDCLVKILYQTEHYYIIQALEYTRVWKHQGNRFTYKKGDVFRIEKSRIKDIKEMKE